MDSAPGHIPVATAVCPQLLAGNQAAAFAERVQEQLGLEPQFINTVRRFGDVVNGYEDVSQHGVDRWAAVVGAWNIYRDDLCVVDAGTAITIDMVKADGQHEGGFILPGLQLMAAALFRDTSDIESLSARSQVADDEHWCGNSMFTAVHKGALLAIRSSICEAANRMGDHTRVVLTGGDAEALLPLDGLNTELHPQLVLEGLRELIREC